MPPGGDASGALGLVVLLIAGFAIAGVIAWAIVQATSHGPEVNSQADPTQLADQARLRSKKQKSLSEAIGSGIALVLLVLFAPIPMIFCGIAHLMSAMKSRKPPQN